MSVDAWRARTIAAAVRAGELRPEDVIRAYLERIEAREPAVHAWRHLDPERVLADARAIGREGLLAGVPLGVKDVIATADAPTESGSPIHRGRRPPADAAVVALARAEGAVVLGKTVTTEFAMYQPGPTTNPHDPRHTPGGSSSGSAAAVAAGMVPVALGTQTAGSIIRPASFCGVVGYKPTFGTLNRVGVTQISESLDTVGVFARDVADAALLVGVLASRPRLAAPAPLAAPRLGRYLGPAAALATGATHQALDTAAAAASAAGARLEARSVPPEHAALVSAQVRVWTHEVARCLAWEHRFRRDGLSPQLQALLDAGLAVGADDYDAARAVAERARRGLDAWLGDADALLVPAAPGTAPAGLASTGDPVFNQPWSLLGVPCVSVPAIRVGGLPVGVQLVGRRGDDARVLAAAAFVERALH